MKADILMDALGMIDDELVESAGARRRGPRVRRAAVIAAAAVLCAALAIPALAAAGMEPACDALYAVAPAVAQRLRPVNLTCVDNGIELEVVAANVHGDSADVYIALRDLTGGRIDGTTDLFDSYRILRPFDSAAGCQLVSYDERERTAMFLIRITRTDGDLMGGDKITFSVGQFLSHKHEFEGALPELDLQSAPREPETLGEVEVRGGSLLTDTSGYRFLAPQPETALSPVPGVQLTAMGYVDGRLHLQAHYDDILAFDNHGFLWLTDGSGVRLECDYSESFWDETRTGSFEEYVFDVPSDALAGFRVWGRFVTCDTLTAGDWQVTFPLVAD